MPIYAFECAACGHSYDRLQKLSDADPVDCPECGESRLRRQLTAPQFRLAGGGWYETDFKKDGDKKRNLAGDGGAGKAGGGDSGKADNADGGKSEKADSGKSAKSDAGTPAPAATKPAKTGSNPTA